MLHFIKVVLAPSRFGVRLLSNGGVLNVMTIKEARDFLTKMVGVRQQWGSEEIIAGSQGVLQNIATSQAELPHRNPHDSFVHVVVPLSDPLHREKYLFANKTGIRFGRLLEDFDTLGGLICYCHNKKPELGENQKSPYAFVTALVDKIELSPLSVLLSPNKDIHLRGNVTWVGTSSMECTMHLKQEIDGALKKVLTARYLFVARNPLTRKAGVVNPLKPETPEDIELFKLGEESKKLRQVTGNKSLLKMPPTVEERLVIHDLFLSTVDLASGTFRTRVKPENCIWMEDAKLKSLIICHPEQRNLYNKIFGGFLMRKAYELAWASASLYVNKSVGLCKTVDDIVFKKPVEIGDLMFLSSQIVYTCGSLMQVHVHAEVLSPGTPRRETTNDFHFTFDSEVPNLPQVMPKTYAESMLFLLGKRHFENHS